METATAESFPSNQNGAISYRPINNFDHADEDDDFGPETNVDNIDDMMSQAVPTKKSFIDSDTIKTSFDQLQTDLDHQVDGESKIGNYIYLHMYTFGDYRSDESFTGQTIVNRVCGVDFFKVLVLFFSLRERGCWFMW